MNRSESEKHARSFSRRNKGNDRRTFLKKAAAATIALAGTELMGLAVFARMDSNRAHDEFYRAHPDWFAIDASGKPYKAGDLFITCVNNA